MFAQQIQPATLGCATRKHTRACVWQRIVLALLLVLACIPLYAHAQDEQPIPALTARVIDQTATLSAAEKEALEGKLKAYEKEKGSQIVVLMVATTQPEDIAQYAWRVGDKWKIGRKGVGDGVLIVVAKDDRRMRIEVTKALEGLLPDTALTRITDSAMKPRFRANDYAGGLNAAVDQIAARLAGDELPAVGASAGQQSAGAQDDGDGVFVAELFVVFFLAPFLGKRLLCNRLGRKKGVAITTGLMAVGSYLYSMDNVIVVLSSLMTMIVLLIITGKAGTGSGGGSSSSGGWVSSSDWSSGSSSSSSSGSSGFSSGGGGDFGGGGASDDW